MKEAQTHDACTDMHIANVVPRKRRAQEALRPLPLTHTAGPLQKNFKILSEDAVLADLANESAPALLAGGLVDGQLDGGRHLWTVLDAPHCTRRINLTLEHARPNCVAEHGNSQRRRRDIQIHGGRGLASQPRDAENHLEACLVFCPFAALIRVVARSALETTSFETREKLAWKRLLNVIDGQPEV
eukprot:CAMPEP_0172619852 /NCGR_PEP_ID=MMETSP1068-20121228/97760_1 /TAXON_ID=35684 /ORGANISM="Pseudopedinella elastica, Strain CCMP716" /LENGTH=185 /DNA_ID=CAMNT_0013426829 /DNA_START=60 /DNA_END=616 /DNA_ORIENTATION=+